MSMTSDKNIRVLITGVSGMLGSNLAYAFRDKYEVLGLYNSHPVAMEGISTEKCDITDRISLDRAVREFSPSVIVHCASMTNVDACEMDRDSTRAVNVLATRNIVECIAGGDTKLIYISTDSVYDGVKGNFSEDDEVNPLNYYGLSKLEGEREARKEQGCLILRTNIFGWNVQDKKSLGEWMLGELQSGRKINCFTDARFSSIYTFEMAGVMDIAVKKNLSGLYNCGSSDSCSKYDFAVGIARRFGLDAGLITPISIDDFKFRARRGKDLSLNVTKIQRGLGYELPTIARCIEAFHRDYEGGLPEDLRRQALYESER